MGLFSSSLDTPPDTMELGSHTQETQVGGFKAPWNCRWKHAIQKPRHPCLQAPSCPWSTLELEAGLCSQLTEALHQILGQCLVVVGSAGSGSPLLEPLNICEPSPHNCGTVTAESILPSSRMYLSLLCGVGGCLEDVHLPVMA